MKALNPLPVWDRNMSRTVFREGVFCQRHRHPEGFHSRLHAHAGVEIVFSESGNGVFCVAGKNFPIVPGALLIFPASLPHRPSVMADYIRWNLCILPGYFDNQAELTQTIIYEHIVLNADRKIRSIFADITSEITAEHRDKNQYIRLLMKQFTLWLHRGRTDGPKLRPELANTNQDSVLADLTDYIEAHLQDDLSVEGLAETVNYSPSQVWRIINSATGLSPIEYITERRLSRARILLRESNQTISSIAHMSGFGSPAYFSRVFKEKTGVTPGEYRERPALFHPDRDKN